MTIPYRSHSWQFYEGLFKERKEKLRHKIIETLKDMQEYGWKQKLLLDPLSPVIMLNTLEYYIIDRYAKRFGFETTKEIRARIEDLRKADILMKIEYEEMQKKSK